MGRGAPARMSRRGITIKVSEEEYELIQQARDAFRKQGFNDAEIPDEDVKKFDWGNLSLGAIVGIAAYVLLRQLKKRKPD